MLFRGKCPCRRSVRTTEPGAWYGYRGERIGQGRENRRGFLKENKDIDAKIDGELRKRLNIGAVEADIPALPAAGPADAKKAVCGRKG